MATVVGLGGVCRQLQHAVASGVFGAPPQRRHESSTGSGFDSECWPRRRHRRTSAPAKILFVVSAILGVLHWRFVGSSPAWATTPGQQQSGLRLRSAEEREHSSAPLEQEPAPAAFSRRGVALGLPATVGAGALYAPVAAKAEEVAASVSAGSVTYDGVATFNGKPKVFVAGATGELGRRVVLDLLKGGYSIRAGARDLGRVAEVQYDQIQARKSPKYNLDVVMDALVEGGRQKQLEEAIGDASVVIDCAGARYGFDIFRPGVGLDQIEPEKTDKNGTKALIDASVARGVKKFIYLSAVLTNAKEMKLDDTNEFKNWNNFGRVLEMKHEAELYLQSSGLDYTIVRPAPMTNDFPQQVGGITFMKPDTITLKSNDQRLISRDDVSLAVVDAIFNPKASRSVFELVATSRQDPTPRSAWWEPKDAPETKK